MLASASPAIPKDEAFQPFCRKHFDDLDRLGRAAESKLDPAVLKIAVVVVLGAIMAILDTTVVSVAQNTFQEEFNTNQAGAAWTITGYTLALAAVIPLSSWAAARFGTRNVYLTSLVLFVLGSALCALAWDITSLTVFRVLQGLGGGMLMPIGMMILTKAAGPARVGSVMAMLGIPMLLGPIMGPIIGGALIEYASWHWIFLINVPIGIAAFFYAFAILPGQSERARPSFDFIGLLLLSPGLALFLYGISLSTEHGSFTDTPVLVTAGIGLLLMIGFVFHATRATNPLLDLSLFKNRKLTMAVTTMTFFMIAFLGAALLFPQYYIGVRGESTLMTGLLLAPQGLGAMLTMPMSGKLTDKQGPGKLVMIGIVLITLGMGAFIYVGPDTSFWLLSIALFVQGLGMGMTMMPIMSAALGTLSDSQVPDGSTLMNVVQQAAGSVGTAITSVILVNNLKGAENLSDMADGFGATFVVTTLLIALCFIPAFFLPRKAVARVLETNDKPVPVMMH